MSRKIELAVEVPGTPEEVWAAIATGPGISSWFMPMEVEEREGGEVAMDFGDYGTERARVTSWEPPHRVVFEGGGERALAYEWLVEARDGGTCIVRLVNTGFGDGDDWDGDYDGMTEGWRIFMQHLRLQLTHFSGRRARPFIPTAMMPGPNRDAWTTLCAELGIPDDASAGDRIQAGADTPDLEGTIESTMASGVARAYLFLLDGQAGSGFVAVEGDGDQVAASLYLYAYDEAAATAGAAWRTWFRDRFTPITSGSPPPAPDATRQVLPEP